MKKTKKILVAALAAVTAVSMGSMSASAIAILDTKIDCSVKNYVYDDETNLSYEYSELAIDENGEMLCGHVGCPTEVIVKMADGAELEANESRYKIEKISKDMSETMQIINKYSFNGNSPYKDIDFNVIDDYRSVYFPVNTGEDEKEAKLFCRELLESGKADYVKLIIQGRVYSPAEANTLDEGELYSLGLRKNLFGFKLIFSSAEDAQNFDPESVEGFAENLNVSIIQDNVMYFQLKEEVQGTDMANVLRTLQNSEAVNNAGATLNFMESIIGPEIAGVGGSQVAGVLGDTNGDNVVDIIDAVNIAQNLLGKKEFDETQQFLADYDCNDKVDILDGVAIAKYLLEKNRK